MPAMTAREFADTIAVPTVEDFMRDPCQRRGYLAAYHLGDYLKPTGTWAPKAICQAMEDEFGAPFLALQRMATAVKHREKTEGGVVLMQSGSDQERLPAGLGQASADNPLRFGDYGGRWVEDGGRRFDMLDLCLIVLRGYAKLYQAELSGSLIDGIRYSTGAYPKV